MTFIRCGLLAHGRGQNIGEYRTWFLGKKQIDLGRVCIPTELHGKRIRFRIEVMD